MTTFDRKASCAVRRGIDCDSQHGAIIPPIVLSSNFSFEDFGVKRSYDYTRSGNPTRDLLAETIAELEQGIGAIITSSGMSSITLVAQLLEPLDTLVAPHDCYGGSYRLFEYLHNKGHCKVVFIDQTDQQQVTEALKLNPRLVWIETPSNPLLRIVDIQALATASKSVGAISVVDNTFLSPALQNPLSLGADIVVHSTTKYLNGHSDVVGGAVVAADKDRFESLKWFANCLGITGSPFDSYLSLRGVRTLFPRIKAHQDNAEAIVDLLVEHPAVAKVYYPGLIDHPGHNIAKRQQNGFGGMASFELHGGVASAQKFVNKLSYFSLAESLGGVESLVAHPATMTHAAMSPEARAKAGVSDSLFRLSIGIEDLRDLLADLSQALDSVTVDDCTKLREGAL